MWLNVVLNDRRVAYPEVKVQIQNLVRVVGIVAPFGPRRGRYRGKIRFRNMRPAPVAPSRGTPRDSQAKLRDWTMRGL